MLLDVARARPHLRDFDLRALFIEELGWDRYTGHLEVSVAGRTFTLTAIAHKRGMVAYACPALEGGTIPDYPTRRKIEQQVAKSIHEHIIVYTDAGQGVQLWQWVKRERGKPAACREHAYRRDQPGDALVQKLQQLAFTLEEEEYLTIFDVASRARAAFDVERVTKRFYDRFKAEHAAFLKLIAGIPDEGLQRWYASVMLNRLMFIYFIQKKGFLAGDTDYLRNKLAQSKERGADRFYRQFLCPLFFEGFAKKESERAATTNQLLGKVPYLNGGLFQRHQIEELHGREIQIGDGAFDKLFDFFEQYQWHLDERPLRADNEINPDVLGYIFEKYVNQKQMGAYYTKEDITEYIAKNTIIPYLLDATRRDCKIAFEGEHSVWRMLEADPDRYVYPALKKGVDLPLPPAVAAGMDDVAQRGEWNKPAAAEYALPTEIWREVVARRKRYEEVWTKMVSGEIRSANDLITYNLDICQFAHDVVENCEGPELLRAFWHALQRVTVLDPACGSGAFLFAALNILDPLYEACLERMQAFLDDLERSGEKHRPEKFSDFRKILRRVADHPNRRYFILKSIVVHNLYGVDIMEEATEICKLRLFLKLVAQVERVEDIEPLPDIDFNIRAGNTLVGFASREHVRSAITTAEDGQQRLLSEEDTRALERIEERAELADRAFQRFREMQTDHGMDAGDFAEAKLDLRRRLAALEDELNRYLASEYGVDTAGSDAYAKWLASHRPFHWFIEFYGIFKHGGFNVIIGNPPYVELSDVTDEYTIRGLQLVGTGNLYSICMERFVRLAATGGHVGVIVPISAVSTPRMLPLMKLLAHVFSPLYVSNFAVRPGKLFVGTDMNLTIFLGQRVEMGCGKVIRSTGYNRWYMDFRPFLFHTLSFSETALVESGSSIPKLGSTTEVTIYKKLLKHDNLARFRWIGPDSDRVFYHSGGRYFRKCIRTQLSNEYKELRIRKGLGDLMICLLSSSLYYWFWILVSDCYHVTSRDIDLLPIPQSLTEEPSVRALAEMFLQDLWQHVEKRSRNRAGGSQQVELNFHVGRSKSVVDKIDQMLATHYGLTKEELDFILTYDIKYRMQNED